jgi:ribosomal protein L11 methyltransferase
LASYPALDLLFAPGIRTEDEERLQAELDGLGPLAIQEHESAAGWLVFFPDPASRDAAVAALAALSPSPLAGLTPRDVPDDDWARRTQANLRSIRAGRIVVSPPWDVPGTIGDGNVVVVIDPSMGFGTGHHETTRLCLDLLQRAGPQGRSVIDVGTGSGVLAIAAWKLGAAAVTAIDSDPDALQNAAENVERNGGRDAIAVLHADLSAFRASPAEIVLANLTAAVLARNAAALRRLVAPAGVLIVSGFSPEAIPEVADALGGADQVVTAVEGEWAAIIVTPTAA